MIREDGNSSEIRNGYLSDPDVQLMLRVRAGDVDAFTELVNRYQQRLLGLFRNYFRDTATIEDLAQDVFLRVFRVRERYKPQARFRTWLFQIAINVARNQKRTLARRRETRVSSGLDSSQSSAPGLAPADKSELMPSRQFAKLELQQQVREAVQTLNDRQRMAVLLSKFEGMSYLEVGDVLGISEQAVKNLLLRARRKLKGQLQTFIE